MEGEVSKEATVSMKGQWIGRYDGDVKGMMIVNIDETKNGYHIVRYQWPFSNKAPNLVAEIKTKNKDPKQEVTAYIYSFKSGKYNQREWEKIRQRCNNDSDKSGVKLEIELKLKDNTLHIRSVPKSDDKLSNTLIKFNKDAPSEISKNLKSWDEFKDEVSKMEDSKQLFRGQQQSWKLKTAFHRGERYVISEFIDKDVEQLHNRLSAITKHYFDLDKPKQNGAFINLLQHYGYPTPLLDWSYSPYIAAFFAFRNVPLDYKEEDNKEEKYIRIYIFDNEAWQRDEWRSDTLDSPFPHLSVMEFSAIDNLRVIPQQAVTTATNIDDIEAYIKSREEINTCKYLKIIDILASERDIVMRDLRLMGITAGSMFPGIDGVCEELRERNFKV